MRKEGGGDRLGQHSCARASTLRDPLSGHRLRIHESGAPCGHPTHAFTVHCCALPPRTPSDLSKLDAGHLTLTYKPAPLLQVATTVMSQFRVVALKAGLSLRTEVDSVLAPHVSTPLHCDMTRLLQVRTAALTGEELRGRPHASACGRVWLHGGNRGGLVGLRW